MIDPPMEAPVEAVFADHDGYALVQWRLVGQAPVKEARRFARACFTARCASTRAAARRLGWGGL